VAPVARFLLAKLIQELINHGKFPIGEFLQLHSSKVLTTNHTFAILDKFNTNHDWKEAFMSIIPKRKLDEGKDESENNE